MKKVLGITLAVFLIALSALPSFGATIYSKVDYTSISSGSADYVSGHGYNNGGNKKVGTESCWGSHCGSNQYASSGHSAYSSYSLYYGHNKGSANQHSWQSS